MFDIRFLENEPPYVDDEGGSGLFGQIVLGDFTERFVAPVGWWSQRDYERQWIEGAQRLVDGASESVFVEEAGRRWWTAWREADAVYVQQRLLVDDAMARAWSASPTDLPYDLVGQRSSHNDEGQELSLWVVTVDDIRGFLSRRLPSKPAHT